MARLLLPLLVSATLTPYVHAGIKFTKPVAGATLTAGTSIDIEWTDDGEAPKLTELAAWQLFVEAGGNEEGAHVRLCCAREESLDDVVC